MRASQSYPRGDQEEKSFQCDAIHPSEFHGITESFSLEKIFKITSKQQPDLEFSSRFSFYFLIPRMLSGRQSHNPQLKSSKRVINSIAGLAEHFPGSRIAGGPGHTLQVTSGHGAAFQQCSSVLRGTIPCPTKLSHRIWEEQMDSLEGAIWFCANSLRDKQKL